MYFTTIDLASGFHQIQMNPRDASNTAARQKWALRVHENALRSQERPCHVPTRYGQCFG